MDAVRHRIAGRTEVVTLSSSHDPGLRFGGDDAEADFPEPYRTIARQIRGTTGGLL